MSSFSCGAFPPRKLLLASLPTERKESLAGSAGFYYLPSAVPDPGRPAEFPAPSQISTAQPWGRLRCRGSLGGQARMFLLKEPGVVVYLGGRLSKGKRLGPELILLGHGDSRLPWAPCSLQPERQCYMEKPGQTPRKRVPLKYYNMYNTEKKASFKENSVRTLVD